MSWEIILLSVCARVKTGDGEGDKFMMNIYDSLNRASECSMDARVKRDFLVYARKGRSGCR